MADDTDIPPLEDMTEVLKQVSSMRTGILGTVTNDEPVVKTSSAKDRAKVKKAVAAKAVNVDSGAEAGDYKNKSTSSLEASVTSASSSKTAPSPLSTSKVSEKSSGGMFGGMKKGFLFGGPPKNSSVSNRNNRVAESVKPAESKEEKSEPLKEKDDIPFVFPKSGKTQSGLTLDDVQQAMSEAKGLLENQDWINDDLLNKVEKNELLLKRFADPRFMKALEEFQTNPTAAMEKYRGNQEVEKFLVEFCGLLGDHFTNVGNSTDNVARSQTSPNTDSQQPKTEPKTSGHFDKKTQPKIIELLDNKSESTDLDGAQQHIIENTNKQSPKIIEIDNSDNSVQPSSELSAVKAKNPGKEIRIHSPSEQADIQEVPTNEDVKEILKDPRVMEILLDPRVMNLIQLLKTDPGRAQRTVGEADADLQDKIKFLVSKGLLQFQT